ncbi:MAG: aminotransferase class III-fold pyridoxal phosphate-dependent enzyme, partial [Clostridiales bacterium]|nr:aminotransferase class III-fold pyridoxal phosphate-dependent enzyme [Clostridiales bacterium]
MNIFDLYESEVRSYCRNYPVVFDKAKNEFLYDVDGNAYLDFFAGAGAINYGHNNDAIKQSLIDYIANDRIMHALDMHTAAKSDFIEYFQEKILKPRGFDYKIQFTGPTGTNAVEAALKLARKVKKRTGIFAMMGAFHGMTMGALSLTTDADSRAGAGVPLHDVTHIPAPYMFPELDTIKYMETLITDDHSGVAKPAAIILEPVQADGGVYPFDAEWLRRLRALCDKHDILMICDDIQVGNARSGHFFSFEHAGI